MERAVARLRAIARHLDASQVPDARTRSGLFGVTRVVEHDSPPAESLFRLTTPLAKPIEKCANCVAVQFEDRAEGPCLTLEARLGNTSDVEAAGATGGEHCCIHFFLFLFC